MGSASDAARRWLSRPAEPTGRGGPRDGAVLKLWDAYTAARGAVLVARRGRGLHRAAPPHRPTTYDRGFFRDHMVHQVLPFWERHAVDARHGGFISHLDRRGGVYDPIRKSAVMQVRLVYAFAKGYEASGTERWRVLAHHGRAS